MDRQKFIECFGGIYEHSAWVAEQAYDRAPVDVQDIDALTKALRQEVDSASDDQKLALLRAHPDLAGKAAVSGELTAASTSEQAGAGLDQCNAEEFARFQSMNDAYTTRFDFPFIMAVKGANRHLILAAFEERLNNSREIEFKTALEQVHRIAEFRLAAWFAENVPGESFCTK
ncbi:2-oxo-4-hydroxy-4-carboxy-5-ureidoimidazoline decarboxylase [Leucothrix mucor]|uniref:2-oxo-4-hydroxy-4-carboxy-5-ureidoimidazoline decarboxylase n=1 Tax=Leucothrix mucor TaxID=45248 RepID=UPI0003B2ED30|nr:2-oxo-4-hydroxy-4-carboxy-5-ureidoimidazoline decarboxylase [Leucothrix mucor]